MKAGMKRKLENVEPKAIKTKAPLKADLIVQLKELQDKFIALEATNNDLEAKNCKHLEKIKFLQEQIKTLKNDNKKTTKDTQTDYGLEFKCTECNFEASSDLELSWHMEKSHGWSNDKTCDDLDSSEGVRDCKRCDYQAEDRYELDGHLWSEHEEDEDGHVLCKFCCEKFANVANLMKHKKIKHREKVVVCKNFNDSN